MYLELESMRRTKHNYNSDTGVFKSEEAMANFQRACMIQKLMEKKLSEKTAVRRNSIADLINKTKSMNDRENSSSCSSDSSSEGELIPIRTRGSGVEIEKKKKVNKINCDSKPNRGFGEKLEQRAKETKSRAMKMYRDLKQPISPGGGGKIAGFLNSIFTSGNLKKPKIVSNSDDSPSLKSASASSFSRSCLSKTPSFRGKSSRSVRFLPVYDECTTANHFRHESSNFELFKSGDSKNFRNVVNEEFVMRLMEKNRVLDQEIEVDESDTESCASSDLFELDNLSAIGGMDQRCSEELPVYETTHLHANQAIAN